MKFALGRPIGGYIGKKKISFKSTLVWDMLVPMRVYTLNANSGSPTPLQRSMFVTRKKALTKKQVTFTIKQLSADHLCKISPTFNSKKAFGVDHCWESLSFWDPRVHS